MLTEKDYCDYDTCVALRELGYVGICDAYYELTGTKEYNRDSFELLYTRDFIHPDDKDRVAAPLLYQAQKWIREQKHLHVTIFSQSQESWQYRITKPYQKLEDGLHGEDFSSYEEALSEGIKNTINFLKENNELV